MENINVSTMRDWFYSRYEDPAERTPYESKEGGYIYLWGGPYEAREVLEGEFLGVYPDEDIESLVSELEDAGWEWARIPDDEIFDKFYYDFPYPIDEYHNDLLFSLNNVHEMVKDVESSALKDQFFNILLVNIITALETYLADAFVNTIFKDTMFFSRFVSRIKDVSAKKIKLNEFYEKYNSVEKYVKEYLVDNVVWHNIPKIKEFYKCSFEVYLVDSKIILDAIAVRNHIVHRNGKDKDGNVIVTTKDNLIELTSEIESFALKISTDLTEKITALDKEQR